VVVVGGTDVLVVDVVELGGSITFVDGGGTVVGGTVVDGGSVDVVVVVGATPVSGDTQPAGGALAPD
jgi:O-acetylhomoserine/O-acetylserine sulfhydrylase-like pyridoxal-dependent enzyme